MSATDADKAAARWVMEFHRRGVCADYTSPPVSTRETLDAWMNELHCYLTSDALKARAREVLDDG